MSSTLANRYVVRGILGQGGMGTVYRCEDQLHGMQEVALKTIKSVDAITADQALRFKEEFRAMARLKHPNTIAVLDFGLLDATSHYITMEVVPGEELAELLARGPLPLDEVYALLIQLLRALGFIHSRRYVHRDIKSQNIRVMPDGTLKLMDFGLMGQLGLPSTGKITGTPGYMAPEVARGGLIDASSDLYSVGCLAYEMVAGRLPFEGRVSEVVRAHLQTPPPPLADQREDLPERLTRIVSRLLEKDQTRRYRRAADVIDDLAALAGVQVARESNDQQASYLAAPTLIGRDTELGALHQALADAQAGRGSALFVAAPAGNGKSRLVQELVLQAKLESVLVLHGQCLETGMAPYEALARALRPGLAHGTDEERDRYCEALAHLFPDLANCEEDEAPHAAEGLALDNAVLSWLRDVSARIPVLWLMDDLHWADPQTLEVFNHVIRQVGTSRILCVGTLRDDETPPGSPVWYTVDEGASRCLTLGPLSPAHQRTLLAAMLEDIRLSEDFAQALYDATGGNAFFLSEVVRSLMEEGTLAHRDGAWHFPTDPGALTALTSIEATVKRRLGHLCDVGRHLAGVAAVLGRYQRLETLLAVSGLEEEVFFSRLDDLVANQFLQRDQDGTGFPHDRVRETLYSELSDDERRAFHQRAGERLEALYPSPDEPTLFELAYHFARGTDDEKAFHYLMRAAALADRAAADAVAVELWLRADQALARLRLPDQAEVSLGLWYTITRNTFILTPHTSLAYAERLMQAIATDPERRLPGFTAAEVYGLAAVAHGFAGNAREAIAASEAVIALVGDSQSLEAASARFSLCGGLIAAGRIDEAVENSHRCALVLAPTPPEGTGRIVLASRVGALGVQNAGTYQGIRPDRRLAEEATEAAKLNDDDTPFTVWMYFGLWPAWTGRVEEAQAYIESTTQKSRRIGAAPYPWVLYLEAWLQALRGNHAQALGRLERAIAFPHVRETGLVMQYFDALHGDLLLALGRVPEAEAAFGALAAAGRAGETYLAWIMGLLGQGEVAYAQGQRAAARAAFEEAYALAGTGPGRNPLLRTRAARALGHLSIQTGEHARAERLLVEALDIAQRPDQDNWLEQAHTLRVKAQLATAYGVREPALAGLRQAGELYHRMRASHWLHGVTTELEELQARRGLIPAQLPVAVVESPEARWKFVSGMLM